jgi:hypothetical protein
VGWHWIDLYRRKTGNSSRLTGDGAAARGHPAALRGAGQLVFPGYGDGDEDAPRSRSTGAIRGAIGRAGCNGNPAQVKRDGRATHHTFRDTFASWLVQCGVSLSKVQQLLAFEPGDDAEYAKLAGDSVADEVASSSISSLSCCSTPRAPQGEARHSCHNERSRVCSS